MAISRLRSFLKTLHPRYQTLHLEYPVDMKPRYGYGKPPHKRLYDLISQRRSSFLQWMQHALAYQDHLVTIPDQKQVRDEVTPGWNNGFLPGLDIVMLYTMVARNHPATYIEVGSGNSTKVAFKAKRDHQLSTRILSIDPAPRAGIDALSDEVIRQPFETVDLSLFSGLKEGDIVFIDNSHRLFPNSDATVFFLEVLPQLPDGVIVHIHDVYLPYDYPQEMCDRYYSEQYGLAAFLLANPVRYCPLMANYFVSEDPELRTILDPLWNHAAMPRVEKHGGSFWLVIRA